MSELNRSNSKSGGNLMPLNQPKIFYGWWIVLAGTVLFIISSGIGFYGHGVFLDPLRAKYGWSKGSISFSVTLYFITTGIIGLIIGRKIDKHGPRPVLITGSLIVGASFMLLSIITEIWQLYAVYILMAVGWSCTSIITISTLITNWFIRRRGLALGITMIGLSLGGIIIVPLATYMIYTWGLKTALQFLGALYCIVYIPITYFVIKGKPSEIGQFHDGIQATETGNPGKNIPGYDTQMRVWTRVQAMKTRAFWAIAVAFMFALAGQTAYLMHQISFLSKSLGVAGAASAVSITAGASIVGRLLLSFFIDRLDKRYVSMILFFMQGAAVLSLAYINNVSILYIGTFMFGLTMGGILMMQSLIIGECFGLISFGTVSGAINLFVTAGAAFGPTIAGVIFDLTQSYSLAFTIFAAMSVLAIIVIPFARQSETGKLPV